MAATPRIPFRSVLTALAFLATAAYATPPIVHPGAPGADPRELTADEAIAIADTGYSPADVQFMQDMIPHHHQAMEMAALVADRTNRQPEIIKVAGRIDASQADEIEFMQNWLAERGRGRSPILTDACTACTSVAQAWRAWRRPEQMEATRRHPKATNSTACSCELMITPPRRRSDHGRRTARNNRARHIDPVLFEFTSDITNDQTAEIERMNGIARSACRSDPRAGLKAAGLRGCRAGHHGTWTWWPPSPGNRRDSSIPGIPMRVPAKPLPEDRRTKASQRRRSRTTREPKKRTQVRRKRRNPRYPMLSPFPTRTWPSATMCMVAGSYHGFNIYKLLDQRRTPIDGLGGLSRADRVMFPSSVTCC